MPCFERLLACLEISAHFEVKYISNQHSRQSLGNSLFEAASLVLKYLFRLYEMEAALCKDFRF